jgi:hypothetical protein
MLACANAHSALYAFGCINFDFLASFNCPDRAGFNAAFAFSPAAAAGAFAVFPAAF